MDSKNQTIQGLMSEVARIDDKDPELEAKLQLIAEKVAAEQQKMQGDRLGVSVDDSQLIDPADAFACEGCQ